MEYQLPARSAQAIVEEIGAVVRQNINMMDCRGYVIASTDKTRIGSLHPCARQMIQEKIPEVYVSPAEATPASRPGLNLAISIEGSIAGVIGITGTYEEVAEYGQIVKKMVEILLRENIRQEEKRRRRRVRELFLEDWILGNDLMQSQNLAERGFLLGIDINVPRRILVAGPEDLESLSLTDDGQKKLEEIEGAVAAAAGQRAPGCLILPSAGRQILLVTKTGDRALVRLGEEISRAVREQTGARLIIGIDGKAKDLPAACIQANKAWRSARSRRGGTGLLTYDQITLELFTEDLPDRIKGEYIQKVFGSCGQEELRQWMGLLEVWFQAEGSLAEAAARLNIHKNTLTYKLKRLEELTGYDVRRPSQSPVFYMAMLFYREAGADE